MSTKCLLVFSKSSVESGNAHPEELTNLLESKGLEVHVTYLEHLVFYVRNGQTPQAHITDNSKGIEYFDVIYIRTWAGQERGHAIALAHIVQQLGIPCIDTELLHIGSSNKLSQYVVLYQGSIPIPRTIMGDPGLLQPYVERDALEYPLVLKNVFASRGNDNYLVRNSKQMNTLCQGHSGGTFIAQEYIPNNGDFRVLVMGGKAKMCIRRTAAKGSHLNNISQGASAELVELDKIDGSILQLSEKAAGLFQRDVAGVDVVVSSHDGRPYVLEVNRAPQIELAAFATEKAQLLAELLANL